MIRLTIVLTLICFASFACGGDDLEFTISDLGYDQDIGVYVDAVSSLDDETYRFYGRACYDEAIDLSRGRVLPETCLNSMNWGLLND